MSRLVIFVLTTCVLANDIMYFTGIPVSDNFGAYEDIIDILLSISVMIAIPGSFFLLYYAYSIRKTYRALSVFLFIVSAFYVFLLLRAWIGTYHN